MKKIFFILFTTFLISKLFSQDCNLTGEARRYWARANAAMESIAINEDYQFVVDELEKALEYAPDCADIYFNLGLAYSKFGETRGLAALDKSINYFKKYLQYSPNAEDKEFVQDQIYGIEFKKEKYLADEAAKRKLDEENKKIEEENKKYNLIGIWTLAEGGKCHGKPWGYTEINLVNDDFRIKEYGRSGEGGNPPCQLYEYSYHKIKQIISYENNILYYERYVSEEDGYWDRIQYKISLQSENELSVLVRYTGSDRCGDDRWHSTRWIRVKQLEN